MDKAQGMTQLKTKNLRLGKTRNIRESASDKIQD